MTDDSNTHQEQDEARLVATPARQRELGWALGEFSVPEDFNDPLPQETEDAFHHSV